MFSTQKCSRFRIPHDAESVRVSQYFANYFVNECRKNKQKFVDSEAERKSLIYNYDAKYTIEKENFEQMYFFPITCSNESNYIQDNDCFNDDST